MQAISKVENLGANVAVMKKAMARLTDIREEFSLVKKVLANSDGNFGKSHFNISKPKSYGRFVGRGAIFQGCSCAEQEQVSIVGMYLSGDAKL